MIIAVKAETESEGASWESLRALRAYSGAEGLPMYLKIGGVEAKTDIGLAKDLLIDGIIAPMVESPFGVEKFALASQKHNFSWRGLTLESATAYSSIDAILKTAAELGINGVTIGRGDLAASMGLRGMEDSIQIMEITKDIAEKAKQLHLYVTMGGKLNPSSIKAAKKLSVPLDAVETRRYVIKFPDETAEESTSLKTALDLEINQEKEIARNLEAQRLMCENRVDELVRRLAMG